MEFKKYKTVLIIEDNSIDLFIAKEVIKKNNFAENIVSYNCVSDAFNYIESLTNDSSFPDIIFTDINLGNATGFEFIDLFNSLPKSKTKNTKIFVVTSSVDPRDIERVRLYNGAVTYKEKYIDPDFLASI